MSGFRAQWPNKGWTMAKTRQQLEKDANALVKLLLFEMEYLAATDAEVAAEPYAFDERRRRMVRKIWNLVKECLAYDPRGEV